MATKVVEYYDRIIRPLTVANMAWTCLSNIQIEWDMLMEKKKVNNELLLPKISKTLPIVAFFEGYDTFVDDLLGSQTALWHEYTTRMPQWQQRCQF